MSNDDFLQKKIRCGLRKSTLEKNSRASGYRRVRAVSSSSGDDSGSEVSIVNFCLRSLDVGLARLKFSFCTNCTYKVHSTFYFSVVYVVFEMENLVTNCQFLYTFTFREYQSLGD